MFKFKFCLPLVLFALFLLVLTPLHSADRLSGGTVLFDDVSTDKENKSNELSVSTVIEDKKTEDAYKKDKSEIDSIKTDIKENFKKIDREQYLDEHTMFKADEEQSFYGINLLVLKINVKRDKSGKVIGLLPEGETQPVTYTDEKNNPDYYLNIERSNYRDRNYSKTQLYNSHKTLLKSFVQRIPREKDAVIIMYMSGSSLKTYSDKEMQLEKTIYAQFVTDFLYRNKRKLTIERRYLDDIPENEIFMIISKYEGKSSPNIYNAPKGNIVQWLARYKELERQQIADANTSRANLEQTLNSTTSVKDSEFLLSPIDRKVEQEKYNIKMSEEDLHKINTRKISARELTTDNTGPRRVLPPEEEIATDTNSQLDDKNKVLQEGVDATNANPSSTTTETVINQENGGKPVNKQLKDNK